MTSKDLSSAQCTLLTIHYASLGDIKALHAFTPSHNDVLPPELVLRILLTYLPEALEPSIYAAYAEEVATRIYMNVSGVDELDVDVSPVTDLTEEQALKKVKKAHLLPLRSSSFPAHAPDDLLTLFLVRRAKQIDEKMGMLGTVPELIEPHLSRNDWIRTWYIGVVLPLLRSQFEYYPQETLSPQVHLQQFENMEGEQGVDFLLRRFDTPDKTLASTSQGESETKSTIARDLRGLVGPWMYGHTDRKRRKLADGQAQNAAESEGRDDDAEVTRRVRKISLTGITARDRTGHDWEYVFRWLVDHAQTDLPLVTRCIDEWDGPGDVDLGGLQLRPRDYLDDDLQTKLELQYGQAAFAACYAAQADTKETVSDAHAILARLAELLNFIPPPDLASSVDALPRIERHAAKLEPDQTTADLTPDRLLRPEHPLTTPRPETYMLLQMMVYSAYQFAGLGHAISLVNAAKLHLYASADEQLGVLKKMLKHLTGTGARKDESQWSADRAKLMWLWNWGIDVEDKGEQTEGAGVLGKIKKQTFETEMLEAFVDSNGLAIATKLYLAHDERPPTSVLPKDAVESIVLAKALELYDGASNGNKTRGGVKKANDIVVAFRPHFIDSIRFRQVVALIAATHALSFYSLTLQHGVPFQPVSIRVSKDPVGLLEKVLEQNPRSYTKLDDLIEIGTNLVSAGLHDDSQESGAQDLPKRRRDAERRVTFMAVEAALREDDFETAYSYIINRLTPSGAEITAPNNRSTPAAHKRNVSKGSMTLQPEDDTSWRAAFLAGRYRPSSSSPHTLRRLEQRTELLSLALLLAPTSALTEILAAWRRCEEETTALRRAEQQAEDAFDDLADQRVSTASLPGNFTPDGVQPEMILDQKRREVGRMGAATGETTAPMSMFDLTRSAASALSRNAFPLSSRSSGAWGPDTANHDAGVASTGSSLEASRESLESADGAQQRVRRRDLLVANVSDSLASGLGWVLGANPQHQSAREMEE